MMFRAEDNIGKRVRVISFNRKSRYENIIGVAGTIERGRGHRQIGVLLDNRWNDASQYGNYWFISSELTLLEDEEENKNMANLTGFKKVAVVDFGTGNYYFALYDNDVEVGDLVYLTNCGRDKLATVKEIISADESKLIRNNISQEVVCKIDTSAYKARVEKREADKKLLEEKRKLQREMDKLIEKVDKTALYEGYAKTNPEIHELLEQYKAIEV